MLITKITQSLINENGIKGEERPCALWQCTRGWGGMTDCINASVETETSESRDSDCAECTVIVGKKSRVQ